MNLVSWIGVTHCKFSSHKVMSSRVSNKCAACLFISERFFLPTCSYSNQHVYYFLEKFSTNTLLWTIEITKICNKSSLINIFHIEIWNVTLKSPTKSSDFIGFLKTISSRISKFSVQHVYSNQHIYWILGNFPSNTFIPTNSFIRDSRVLTMEAEKEYPTLKIY